MFSLEISPEGAEPFVLHIDSRDIARWEMGGKGRALANLERGRLVDLYSIAYVTASRRGLWSGSEEEFLDACLLDQSGSDDEADPTQPEA